MAANNRDDKTGTNELMSLAPNMPTVQPAEPHVHPRTHLFGIPQELQDQIFDEVFNNSVPRSVGAQWLRPLLTCRHIYHIANKKAWAGAVFSTANLTVEKLLQLKSDIPSVVSLRKAYILVISRDQLPIICTSYKLLPHFRMVNVASPSTSAQKKGNEVHEWHKALIMGVGLSRAASIVTFPPEAFTKSTVMAIELESSLRLLSGLMTGENRPTSKIKHEKNGKFPEHYTVTLKSNEQQPRTVRVFRGAAWRSRSVKTQGSEHGVQVESP